MRHSPAAAHLRQHKDSRRDKGLVSYVDAHVRLQDKGGHSTLPSVRHALKLVQLAFEQDGSRRSVIRAYIDPESSQTGQG